MTSQIITQGMSAADLDKLDLIADIQFNEPLGSAAINRKFFGLFPEGVYRGFNAVPAGGLTVSLCDDPVNVAVINVDGFMINVHSLRPIKLEIPVGREVYAILEANYAIGRRTTQTDINASIKAADLRIINPNELRKNHVIVFSVNLPLGTTEIKQEHIKTDKRQQSTALDDTAVRILQELDKHIKNANPHPQYALLDSPAFTGSPTTTALAKTARGNEVANAGFVHSLIDELKGSAPELLDALDEVAKALGNDPNFAATMLKKLSEKMSKEANGSDIPDKAKFLDNLGLAAIIQLAKGALQRTGGHLTGDVVFDNNSRIIWDRNTDGASIFFKNDADADTDSYMAFETADNNNEYFRWQHRLSGSGAVNEWMSLKPDGLRVLGGKVYHEKNRQKEQISLDARDVLPNQLVRGAMASYFRHSTVGDGQYMDFLTLNSYVDTSGGNINAIAISKVNGRLYHHSVPFGSASWGKAYAIYSELHKPTPAELNVYAKGESDARYYLRTDCDARYYAKWEADGRYATKGELNNIAASAGNIAGKIRGDNRVLLFDGIHGSGNISLNQNPANFDAIMVMSTDDGGNHTCIETFPVWALHDFVNGGIGSSLMVRNGTASYWSINRASIFTQQWTVFGENSIIRRVYGIKY